MTRERERLPVPNLDEGLADDATFGARIFAAVASTAIANPIPSLLVELVGLIPRQRIDRVADFARKLGEAVNRQARDADQIRARIEADAQRIEILERGCVAAERASAEDRRLWIAELVARGMTSEERTADEVKKLLLLLESLTDNEVLHLIWCSLERALGGIRSEFYQRHREVLTPASGERGIKSAETDRKALQDAYLANLARLGLVIHNTGNRPVVSPLGRLLLRYIGAEDER